MVADSSPPASEPCDNAADDVMARSGEGRASGPRA